MGNAWQSKLDSLSKGSPLVVYVAQAGATGGVNIAMFNLLYGGETAEGDSGLSWAFEMSCSVILAVHHGSA